MKTVYAPHILDSLAPYVAPVDPSGLAIFLAIIGAALFARVFSR